MAIPIFLTSIKEGNQGKPAIERALEGLSELNPTISGLPPSKLTLLFPQGQQLFGLLSPWLSYCSLHSLSLLWHN